MKLYAPVTYWATPKEEMDKIAGGCGPGGLGDLLVPDKLLGLSVRPACRIHDFMYHTGWSLNDPLDKCNKEAADRVFLNNMVRIIQANTKSLWLTITRLWLAKKYYYFVKTYGSFAFWGDKNQAAEFREYEEA